MTLDLYQIDAFTDKIFGGNPAAVCPLQHWLQNATLQNIASENNLSETAFYIPSTSNEYDFDLRWFMPEGEVDLCGHATMAAAYVIFNHSDYAQDVIRFSSRSGLLTIKKTTLGLQMDLPVWNVTQTDQREDISHALGIAPTALFRGKYWMAVYDSHETIQALKPDFNALKSINDIDFIIVTSPADDPDLDFVSRFFCPKLGVDEDPVTGSAHCVLTPYWAQTLGSTNLNARQVSKRGGNLICELRHDRVLVSGQAALYMHGKIHVQN